MANDGPLIFHDIHKDAFYFEVADSVVDGDTFCFSGQSLMCSIRSRDNMVLLVNTAGQFRLKHLILGSAEHKFHIHVYNNMSAGGQSGSPVMLYAEKDGKKLVVCCGDDNQVYSDEMVPPEIIEEHAHKALFQMEMLPNENYMFRSTTLRSKFLGFTCVEGNPSLKKLVLCSKGPDGINESAELVLDH